MKTLKRRRLEFKTDYNKRIKLLKSQRPRIVFRRTNKYVIVQYVTSYEAQDKVELGLNSKILLKYGWPESAKGSLRSIRIRRNGKRIRRNRPEKNDQSSRDCF